jgi:phenolic acid decarboxylase
MLVLLAAPAFGSSKKPQTVIIPQNVQVGSTQLSAGTYKLAWTGSAGSDVQVTLTQAGKTVLTFAAKAVEQKNDPGVDVNTIAGVAILKAINLDNVSLQVESAPHPGQ